MQFTRTQTLGYTCQFTQPLASSEPSAPVLLLGMLLAEGFQASANSFNRLQFIFMISRSAVKLHKDLLEATIG